MNLDDKVMDVIQKNLGKLQCKLLSQTKFVCRGYLVYDSANDRIDTSNMYIVMVDKSTGKDLSKNAIEFHGSIKKSGKVKIGVESKLQFPRRKK